MDLQDHMISFVCKWQVVRSLEKYAAGQDSELALVNLDLAARRELVTDEGKAILMRWLKVFRPTRGYMAQFSATYNTIQYNRADWRIMDQSVTTMLSLLERNLINSAIERCSPSTAV